MENNKERRVTVEKVNSCVELILKGPAVMNQTIWAVQVFTGNGLATEYVFLAI